MRPALGALASLIAASSCCLPLGPLAAAAGAAGASAFLVPARPWLMSLSVVLLVWGFWQAYSRKACDSRPARWSRVLLWFALTVNAALLFFPQRVANLLAGAGPAPSTAPISTLESVDTLRAEFNAAAEQARVLVLLSPT